MQSIWSSRPQDPFILIVSIPFLTPPEQQRPGYIWALKQREISIKIYFQTLMGRLEYQNGLVLLMQPFTITCFRMYPRPFLEPSQEQYQIMRIIVLGQ